MPTKTRTSFDATELNSDTHSIGDTMVTNGDNAPRLFDNLMTYREIADHFHVTKRTVYRWVHQGYLTPIPFGGRVKFSRSEVERLGRKGLSFHAKSVSNG